MKNIALCLLIVFFISCKKDPPLWEVKNLNDNKIDALGHGGMGIFSLLPMNSSQSIKQCLDIGAAGSEMDVQMSRDSVLFLYHNESLEEATHCEGRLSDKTAAEINCEYRSLTHKGIKVIELKKFIEENGAKSSTLIFTLECKLNGNSDSAYLHAFANKLVEIPRFPELTFVESTDINFLRLLQKKNKGFSLFLYTTDFIKGLAYAKQYQLFGLTFDMHLISTEQIAEAHANNVRITLFNQQSEADNLTAIQMSPDFIQTDKLEHLLKVQDRYVK